MAVGIFGSGTIFKRGEGSVDMAIVLVLETDVAVVGLSVEFEELGVGVATLPVVGGRWRCSSGRLRV